jgi:hypothetical protein
MKMPFKGRSNLMDVSPEVGMALITKASNLNGASVGEWKAVQVHGEDRLCNYGAESRDGEKVYFATIYAGHPDYDPPGLYYKATSGSSVDDAIATAIALAEANVVRQDPEPAQIPAAVEIAPEIDEEDVLTAVLLNGIWTADEAGLFSRRSQFPEAAKVIAKSVMEWLGKMDDEPE